jgi:beta-galactosidase GanA
MVRDSGDSSDRAAVVTILTVPVVVTVRRCRDNDDPGTVTLARSGTKVIVVMTALVNCWQVLQRG